MKRKITFILAGCLILFNALPSYSCVGRILTLSINDSPEQKVIGQLLATYITERTGTTVNLTTALDLKASEELLVQCKADIFLNYLNVGLTDMKDGGNHADTQESYSIVKQYYLTNKAMVWLKPLGYKGPVSQGNESLAIPVASQDALNRFPVLDRVINKLSGRIDDRIVQQLIEKAQTDGVEGAVKGFLKAQNLI